MSPSPSAVILGAGRTGRGLAAALCARSHWPFALVDRERSLCDRLRSAGGYPLEVLGTHRPPERLVPSHVVDLEDPAWHALAVRSRVIFTAVFGPNLAGLGAPLAAVIRQRLAQGGEPLDLITCENLTHAAHVLRTAVESALGEADARRARSCISFVEAMVLTTSLAAPAAADPLLVRTQNAFRLPCDGDAFVAGVPAIAGLEPLPRFSHQLMRKIYTYNGINAVISYLGAERGHPDLAAAARDPQIAPLARQAGNEASQALIATYGFDPGEQQRWAADAMAKFEDRDIPDPISRNAADPSRKLARDDRLVGPALLALSHGITPTALAVGIASACRYRDGTAPSLREVHGSYEAVLAATAGLGAVEPLVQLVAATARPGVSGHG